jgi:hypothetical protein
MIHLQPQTHNRWLLRSIQALTALVFLTSSHLLAQAQDLASNQCGQYVEAYQGGSAAYTPYLQAAEQVAKARDAQQGSTRYLPAFHASARPCRQRSLAQQLVLEESKCECIFDKKSGPPAVAMADGPSSCKVGDNGPCSVCSVSCANGKTATCKQGSPFAGGKDCAFQAKCDCK